jgi:hypothetical protein
MAERQKISPCAVHIAREPQAANRSLTSPAILPGHAWLYMSMLLTSCCPLNRQAFIPNSPAPCKYLVICGDMSSGWPPVRMLHLLNE